MHNAGRDQLQSETCPGSLSLLWRGYCMGPSADHRKCWCCYCSRWQAWIALIHWQELGYSRTTVTMSHYLNYLPTWCGDITAYAHVASLQLCSAHVQPPHKMLRHQKVATSKVLSLLYFRETYSSATWSLYPQPRLLSETDLHGNKKNTAEKREEHGRKTIDIDATGKRQELTKVVFHFPITIHVFWGLGSAESPGCCK